MNFISYSPGCDLPVWTPIDGHNYGYAEVLPKPYTCPVCNGSGKVSRPPWIAGDVETWPTSSGKLYTCQACNGKGIVWK